MKGGNFAYLTQNDIFEWEHANEVRWPLEKFLGNDGDGHAPTNQEITPEYLEARILSAQFRECLVQRRKILVLKLN